MKELDARTLANVDVALEETCRSLPNGGNHEVRRYIARKLLASARQSGTTLKELMKVGRRAMVQITKRKRP